MATPTTQCPSPDAAATAASTLKEKNVASVGPTHQMAPSSSTRPEHTFDNIDLSGLDETTLTVDFKVGKHVSIFYFDFTLGLSGARSALPMGIAPESMLD